MIDCIYDNSTIRRQDRLLEVGRAEGILRTAEYGVLSMTDVNGHPYGIPINYVWDGNKSLYAHCAQEGKKLNSIEKSPDVSFCIVGSSQVRPEKLTTLYESIVIRGKAFNVKDPEERRKALRLLVNKFAPGQIEHGRASIEKSFHRTGVIRIDIETISGKAKKKKGINMDKLLIFKSPLHDQESVLACRKPMIEALEKMGVEILDASQSPAISQYDRIICFVGTGGTEEIFREQFKSLKTPVILLGDGYHNSFAASFEIATFLQQNGVPHKLVNIPLGCNDFRFIQKLFESSAEASNGPEYDPALAAEIYQNPKVADKLRNSVIGLIGGASSWLISSDVDTEAITERTGARFVHIPIKEVEETYKVLAGEQTTPDASEIAALDERTPEDLHKAEIMYRALDRICNKYGLTALTLKCFDLLDPCNTTACYALAKLNDRGIISGCEGDIPSLWTMIVASAITGQAPFMANPSSSNSAELTIDFAHCTIPLKMVKSYRLPSHFESRIGIGITGQLPEGEYRLLKIGGPHLDKVFSCSGQIICNTRIDERCRTQVRFKFESATDYERFMANRTGNHVIIMQ